MRAYFILIYFIFLGHICFSTSQNTGDDTLVYTAPDYDNPKKYHRSEFSFNSDSNFVLFGTSLVPKKKKKAICIFVHTIGIQDRDASFEDTKIFKDIAKGLAVQRVASYRFDKRTYTYPQNKDFTIETETINDVLALIRYVQLEPTNKDVPIFIIGYGFGGKLSPKIADLAGNDITGIIALSTITEPLEDVLFDQFKLQAKKNDTISTIEQEVLDDLIEKRNHVKHHLSDSSQTTQLPLAIPASYWISLKNYNFYKTIKKLEQPILFLYGGDAQLKQTNDTLFQEAIRHEKQWEFLSFAGLDETFIPISESGGIPKEMPHVKKDVIDAMVEWIKLNATK